MYHPHPLWVQRPRTQLLSVSSLIHFSSGVVCLFLQSLGPVFLLRLDPLHLLAFGHDGVTAALPQHRGTRRLDRRPWSHSHRAGARVAHIPSWVLKYKRGYHF